MTASHLRGLAVAGIVVTALVALWDSSPLPARFGGGLLVAGLLLLATGGVVAFLLPVELRLLARRLDVLVPLGVAFLAQALVAVLVRIGVLGAWWSGGTVLPVGGLTIGVSLAVVASLAIWILYAAWTTVLVLRAVRGRDGDLDLVAAWHGGLRRLPRVLAALAVGAGGMLVVLALSLALLPLGLGLVAVGVLSVVWNLVTWSLLLDVVDQDTPLLETLGDGFRAGRAHARAVAGLLLPQLLLLGLVCYASVSYGSITENGSSNWTQRSNVTVNAVWLGSYPSEPKWYQHYCATAETSEVAYVAFALQLALSVLAVLIKLALVRRLPRYAATPTPVTDAGPAARPPPSPAPG